MLCLYLTSPHVVSNVLPERGDSRLPERDLRLPRLVSLFVGTDSY